MVIISAIFSVTDVVVRGIALLSRVPDRWYKGGTELQSFKSSLSILSQKPAPCERQLEQHGRRDNRVFQTLLAEAVRMLDAEKEYFERHQKSWVKKLKGRAFPEQLAYILSNIRGILEAGPEIRATRSLLNKKFLTDLSLLPFRFDEKYVPLQGTVDEVLRTLEDPDEPQVVTLYGEPGSGKSSLAKYVVMHYQDLIHRSTSCLFDGVQYLFCGQGCRLEKRRLRKVLLSNLGFGAMTEAIEEGQEEDQSLPLYQSALRRVLGGRRLLIVLDDVWAEDFEVFTSLVSHGTPTKYLVTSQTRNVWLHARCIKVPRPTYEQALKILSNYIEEFPSNGQAPFGSRHLEGDIKVMLAKLENHPLSLVNVAVSMNRDATGRTSLMQWRSLIQNIFSFLDQNGYPRVLVYERPYSLSVSASMMLMIESLRAAERNLFFLISLIKVSSGRGISESLIRFFFKRFCQENSSQSRFRYFSALKYLQDNSLVQVGTVGSPSLKHLGIVDHTHLKIHALRGQYIREKSLPSLQSVANRIVATNVGSGLGDQHTERFLVNFSDSDQCVAVVLSTIYFDDGMRNEVAIPFRRVVSHMTGGGVVSRSLQQKVTANELADVAKDIDTIFVWMSDIFELLSMEGDEPWKQQAHLDASKMIMKLVCNEELDDKSMASLLTIPHTTDAACHIFEDAYLSMIRSNLEDTFFFGFPKSLSSTHPETWRALSNLYMGLSATEFGCYMLSNVMPCVLEFESESTISVALQRLGELAAQFSEHRFQKSVIRGYLGLQKSRLTHKMLHYPALPENLHVPTIMWKIIDDQNHVQSNGEQVDLDKTFQEFSMCAFRDKDHIKPLLTSPIPCKEWLQKPSLLKQLLKLEQRLGPRSMLGMLSGTPEFHAVAIQVLKENCWAEDFTLWPESSGDKLARFWGNVALVQDLHDNINLGLVKLAKSWVSKLEEIVSTPCSCSCQANPGENCHCSASKIWSPSDYTTSSLPTEVARAVTIISHLHASSSLVTLGLQGTEPDGESHGCKSCLPQTWCFYMKVCTGKAKAYSQMEMYGEAIASLELAQRANEAFGLVPSRYFNFSTGYRSPEFQPSFAEIELRAQIVFLKVSSRDYQGAMDSLQERSEQHGYRDGNLNSRCGFETFWPEFFWKYGNRGVLLTFLGEYAKAVSDFDQSLEYWDEVTITRWYTKEDPKAHNFLRSCLLTHRAHAKYLMNDLEGCRVDMEAARILKSRNIMSEPWSWECFARNSMGYKLEVGTEKGLNYSLLQLPAPKYFL